MNKKMDTEIFKTVYEARLKLFDAELNIYNNLDLSKEDDPEEAKEVLKEVNEDIKIGRRRTENAKDYTINNPFQAYNLSIGLVWEAMESNIFLELDEEFASLLLSLPDKVLNTQTFQDELKKAREMYTLLIDDITDAHNCTLIRGRLLSQREYNKIKEFAEERLQIIDSYLPENVSLMQQIDVTQFCFDFQKDVNARESEFKGEKYFNEVLFPLLQERYWRDFTSKDKKYTVATISMRYYAAHRLVFKYDFEKMKSIIICQELSAADDDFLEIENDNFWKTITKLPRELRFNEGVMANILTHKRNFDQLAEIINGEKQKLASK